MKIVISLLVLSFIFPVSICADDQSFIKHFSEDLKLEKYKKKSLRDREIKAFSAFIFTVLANTQELRIHQMNGEIHNEVYIRDEGHEAVFIFDIDEHGEKIDGTGRLVKDCLNMGSFNYYHPYKTPLGHFAADILPWLIWGNCAEDPSSLNQRIEAYMLDFREGYARALSLNEGYYLPHKFKFKRTGQSETIAFFAKALKQSEYDFSSFFPSEINIPQKQDEFFQALENGIKALLNDASKSAT